MGRSSLHKPLVIIKKGKIIYKGDGKWNGIATENGDSLMERKNRGRKTGELRNAAKTG